MREGLTAEARRPFDIEAVNQIGGRTIIESRNHTFCETNQILKPGEHDEEIERIAEQGVRLIDHMYLMDSAAEVLPTVMRTKRELRLLLKTKAEAQNVNASEEEVEQNLEAELVAFGTIIDTLKQSSFKELEEYYVLLDILAALGVHRVSGGAQSVNPMAEVKDREARFYRATKALELKHAQLDYEAGVPAEEIAERTGFETHDITSRYSPYSMIDRILSEQSTSANNI